ncbi:MAG TPA: ABC transporter permease [Candidatus Baltobacteraceae bacterium]|jgi:simple sugar transport system permease protein|nr:ABC transporter permease [Candidatus Baltobacteraceae bacterium]
MNRFRALNGPLGAALLILALMSTAMIIAGTTPVEGFAALLKGALGGRNEIGETLVATTALLFPALGIALAFRAGLFNIGAEGQLLIGALFAGAAGPLLNVPPVLGIPLLFVLGALGGGLWGGIAGWMKARFNANEIIATLMLNFVAAYIALDLVSGPLRGPEASGAETAWLPAPYWLPTLIPHTRLSIGILVAIALAFALQVVFSRTVFGYELRASGDAPEAARRNGVNLNRITWLSLALSGAIAGMGGAAIVSGELHRFNTQLSPGYGFTAIAVALVGDLQPLWVCVAAFGFGILEAGGLSMQASVQVPKDAIHIIEGLIILILAARRYVATRTEGVPA